MASRFLTWEIVKNHHAYIMKRPNIRTLSKEPGNVRNIHSFKANGFIHPKTIDIQPAKDNKGVVITRRKRNKMNRPAAQTKSMIMKTGPRRLLWKVARVIVTDRYRHDLKKAAMRRASAILQSQKPKKIKKRGGAKPAAKK
ncbi:unnamed protein product [Notodromas monacha]|uniref:Large ribosomal subunit protein eL28 n=1 Tax=Notodromas monacha TaxID=399045 RepID=A0A7R9BGS5_9CRUS|nr:unnamed protein product [Notodromas monacha]CAG0915196.1 unnamed protein product [Notodromas monacha]